MSFLCVALDVSRNHFKKFFLTPAGRNRLGRREEEGREEVTGLGAVPTVWPAGDGIPIFS